MVRLLHYSDIENIYDDAERAGRFAGRLAELDGEDALVVGTGDNTAPGVVSLAARGRQALDLVSVVGTTADTFGNHDFDYGPEEARSLVAESENTWVSANVHDEEGGPFAAAEGAVPWTIAEADGERVGFFGLTDPATDSINPQAAPLTFTDPYEAAEDAVAALRAEGVDYVVALSHLGGGDDELASRVDIDAVLGGHVHSVRTEFVGDTICTRPGVNGHKFVEITLTDDDASARVVDPSEGPVHEELREALQRRREAAGLTDGLIRVSVGVEHVDDLKADLQAAFETALE